MGLNVGNLTLAFHSGALIPVLILLPNLVWMLAPKKEAGKPGKEPLWLTIAENVGRELTIMGWRRVSRV